MVYLKTGERLTRERMLELQEKDPSGLIILHFLDPEKRPATRPYSIARCCFRAGRSPPMPCRGRSTARPLRRRLAAAGKSNRPSAHRGCFSRVLGRYVRERKVLSLMDAVRRCSLIPAQILEESTPQMKNKGRIKVGADADIIVFDADKIIDRATYAKPAQTSAGFRLVLVNGVAVVRDGELVRTAMPGRPIRPVF